MLGWEPGWPQLSLGPDKPEKKKACCEGKEAPADKGGKGILIPSAPKPSATLAGWAGQDVQTGGLGSWRQDAGSLLPGDHCARLSQCPGWLGWGLGLGQAETGWSTLALPSHQSLPTIIPMYRGVLEPLMGPKSYNQSVAKPGWNLGVLLQTPGSLPPHTSPCLSKPDSAV